MIVNIQSYDHFVWFRSQTVYIRWIPLETSKVGENYVKTRVVLKKFLFGRIFGSGTFSKLLIFLFHLRWLLVSQSLSRSDAFELKFKPSVLPCGPIDPILVWNQPNFRHIDSQEHSEVLSFDFVLQNGEDTSRN